MDWARRFILFHQKRHPQDMGAAEVEAFLSHLAVVRQVSASTQNQAKSALLYLYKQVLGLELPWLDEVVQAKRPQRLPVWHGYALAGIIAFTGEGCGVCAPRACGA